MSRGVGLAREKRANSRFESILDPQKGWVWAQVELGRECRLAYFTQEVIEERFLDKASMASSEQLS